MRAVNRADQPWPLLSNLLHLALTFLHNAFCPFLFIEDIFGDCSSKLKISVFGWCISDKEEFFVSEAKGSLKDILQITGGGAGCLHNCHVTHNLALKTWVTTSKIHQPTSKIMSPGKKRKVEYDAKAITSPEPRPRPRAGAMPQFKVM